MKQVIVLLLGITFFIGQHIYTEMNTKEIISYHTVAAGDTIYGICNKTFRDDSNECFNAYFDRAMTNNKGIIQIGQKVKLVHRVKK